MEIISILFSVVIVLSNIILAFAVYLSDKKAIANKLFLGIAFGIILWICSSFVAYSSTNSDVATNFFRINFLAVTLTLLFFYSFSIYFPKKSGHYFHFLNPVIYSLGIFIILVSSFTDWVIKDTNLSKGNLEVQLGVVGYLFYFFVFLVSVATLYNMTKKYNQLDRIEKSKTQYFLVGLFIYTFLNIFFNFFIFFIFPSQTRLTQFGDFSAITLVIFTAFAILKRQLFNIKVVATEVIVIALSIGLAVEIFVSTSITEGVVKAVIWLLATYGGYVLIKSVQTEIKQKEDLEVLAQKLDKANHDLEELDETKDNFLSMATHELNTPIAAIEGYLSMIIDEKMGGEINEKALAYLKNVYMSSKRLAALVRDLLNVSRIESNRIHLINTESSIEDVINQAIAEIKIKADEVGHKLVFEKPAKPIPRSWFDATRITEVVINLIGNSIKYTEPPGKIVVRAHADDDKIVVSVEDNGRGIPADRAEHVFEKFSQVDVLKDQVKGTGLGMFISKNLVNLHRGKLWFKSSVDPVHHGTTFYFSLPILKEKPADPHESEGAVIKLK